MNKSWTFSLRHIIDPKQTSHYLNQHWSSSVKHIEITRLQQINSLWTSYNLANKGSGNGLLPNDRKLSFECWCLINRIHKNRPLTQIAKTFRSMSIRRRSDVKMSDWCLINVDLRVCATVYPKKYAHVFVVPCFVVVMQSFIMNSHEVFIHIHQGCFAGTGAIVRLPQCQWSKPDGYGKISQCMTTTKHSKAKTVCIFLGIYCIWVKHFQLAMLLLGPLFTKKARLNGIGIPIINLRWSQV